MMKFQALLQHLMTLNLFNSDQIECWVDRSRLIPSGKKMNQSGDIKVLEKHLTVDFLIEDFANPGREDDLLSIAIIEWLAANDDNRVYKNLPTPELMVEVNDHDLADVAFSIEFVEDVLIAEDEDGLISIGDKTYNLVDTPAIHFAEEVAVKPEGAA